LSGDVDAGSLAAKRFLNLDAVISYSRSSGSRLTAATVRSGAGLTRRLRGALREHSHCRRFSPSLRPSPPSLSSPSAPLLLRVQTRIEFLALGLEAQLLATSDLLVLGFQLRFSSVLQESSLLSFSAVPGFQRIGVLDPDGADATKCCTDFMRWLAGRWAM
jgi:hypothetical protein